MGPRSRRAEPEKDAGLDVADELPDDADSPGRRSGRRRAALVACCVLAALAIGAGIVGAVGLGGSDDAAPAPQAGGVATVETCTLSTTSSVSGELGYGPATALVMQAAGTITWLPAPGTVVDRGQQLIRVDDRPVTLLIGEVPQFRQLAVPTADAATTGSGAPTSGSATPTPTSDRLTGATTGTDPVAADPATTTDPATTADSTDPAPSAPAGESSAPADGGGAPAPAPAPAAPAPPPPPLTGSDVRQLQQNLADLGYQVRVTGTYSEATATAVRAWQRDLGVQPTGVVGLGDVVYATGPLRIVPSATAQLGAAVAAGVLTTTSQQQVVTATVQAGAAWAVAGTQVTLAIPGVGDVPGTVASAAAAPATAGEPDGGSAATDLALVVTVADQGPLATATPGSVTVTHVDQTAADVLCAPVVALVALAEGGYGLQLDQPGPAVFRAVTTGLVVDGRVQVSGDGVTAGLKVQVPADD